MFRRAVDRWRRALTEGEEAGRMVHNAIATRLARDLRGTSARNINRAIRRAFDAFEGDRARVIEDAIRTGARTGDGLTEAVARAVFGDRDARAALSPVIEVADDVAQRHIGVEMNGESVRSLLRRRTGVLTRKMGNEVAASVRLGESTKELADRVMGARDITIRLPRYIEEVQELARTAPPSVVRATVRRQLEALGSSSAGTPQDIRRATRRFLRQVEQSQGADIDNAVEQWVRGRAHNQAMTIARTEGHAALNEAYFESTRGQDWIVGYRWNLNPSHRVMDICDVMANQDNFGLGGGGYPKEEVPSLAHPNDLCFFTAITDEHYLARERARVDGTAEPPRPWETEGGVDGRTWLQQQPAHVREEILGPGRAREFDRRPTRVVNTDGSFQPLYTIQGRRPPPLPDGERFQHRRNGEVRRLGQRRRRRRP